MPVSCFTGSGWYIVNRSSGWWSSIPVSHYNTWWQLHTTHKCNGRWCSCIWLPGHCHARTRCIWLQAEHQCHGTCSYWCIDYDPQTKCWSKWKRNGRSTYTKETSTVWSWWRVSPCTGNCWCEWQCFTWLEYYRRRQPSLWWPCRVIEWGRTCGWHCLLCLRGQVHLWTCICNHDD